VIKKKKRYPLASSLPSGSITHGHTFVTKYRSTSRQARIVDVAISPMDANKHIKNDIKRHMTGHQVCCGWHKKKKEWVPRLPQVWCLGSRVRLIPVRAVRCGEEHQTGLGLLGGGREPRWNPDTKSLLQRADSSSLLSGSW
jgi:hypothetical protein